MTVLCYDQVVSRYIVTSLLLWSCFCMGVDAGGTCRQAPGIPGKQLTCLDVSPNTINTSLSTANVNVTVGFYSDFNPFNFCFLVFRWANGIISSQDFSMQMADADLLWGNTT